MRYSNTPQEFTRIHKLTYTILDATTYFRANSWVSCYATEGPSYKKQLMQQHSTFCVAIFLAEGHAANLVLIPKIMLRPSDIHLLFQFCFVQLPVNLPYSMTINKKQEQTFQKVRLNLTNPVFAHGQFYDALSRATTKECVRVKLQETEE